MEIHDAETMVSIKNEQKSKYEKPHKDSLVLFSTELGTEKSMAVIKYEGKADTHKAKDRQEQNWH